MKFRRTKKKNIYVISTLHLLVPLEHYLYAGRETYEIVDQKGQRSATFSIDLFSLNLLRRYKDAGEALRRKQDKKCETAGLPPVQRLGAAARANPRGGPAHRGGPVSRGGCGRHPGGSRGGGQAWSFPSVDENLYVHLLGHLRKKSLLPVVVFTF